MLLPLDRFIGKIAVVTGASSGIGAAVLEKLVLEGVNVVGLARRVERIEKLAEKLNKLDKGKVYGIKCDISNKEDVLKAFEWIENNLEPIHILINNAAILRDNTLIDGDYNKWKQTFDTNVLGLCLTTREAIKSMKKHQVAGHIVNVNSTAGHQVANIPRLNVYSATKFATKALTETLRFELLQENSDIKITSLHPGAVRTEFGNDLQIENMKEFLDKISFLSAEHVADSIIYILSTPPQVQIKELTIKPLKES